MNLVRNNALREQNPEIERRVDNMEKKLRHSRNTLVIIGTGVIIFGIWSIVKSIAVSILGHNLLNDAAYGLSADRSTIVFFHVQITLFLFVDLILRLFVGLTARAEGLGKKKGNVYVAIAGALTVIYIITVVLGIYGMKSIAYSVDSVLEAAVSFLIEMTSLFTMLDLFLSAVRVKLLTKQTT